MNELIAECAAGSQPAFIVIAALCDVDERSLVGAESVAPQARLYRDFRKLFEDVDDGVLEVDAVMVSTPDHTHACATSLALACRLPVYCEKPLTHTASQARAIARLAQEVGVPTQMGNQIHAGDNYRAVVELIRSGAIGEVTAADGWDARSWCCGALTPDARVPDHLNWDLWQGPAAASAYIDGISPGNWRRYWNYGNGTLGDMACHILDLPFWALGLAERDNLSAEVRATGPSPDLIGCPTSLEVSWAIHSAHDLPRSDPLNFRWFDGGSISPTVQELAGKDRHDYAGRFNMLFQGTKGFLFSNYNEHLVLPHALAAEVRPPAPTLPRLRGHHREWIDAVRAWVSGRPDAAAMTSSNFAYAARLTELVLIGTAAFRAQSPISYDFGEGAFTGPAAERATRLLNEPARDGWQMRTRAKG